MHTYSHARVYDSWTEFSPVCHTDVGYIGPSDVIPSRTILPVVLAYPVLLHLYTHINKRTQ